MALANSRGVTRWRRSAVIAVPAALAVGGMAAAMLNGVLAASLSVSSADMKLTATQVTTGASGLSLVGQSSTRTCTAAQKSANLNGCSATVSTYNTGNAQTGIPSATLNTLCVSAPVTVPGIAAGYSVKINIPGTATSAQNLLLSADSINATGSSSLGGSTADPIALGVSADQAGNGTSGAAGEFGLSATGGVSTLGALNANAQKATIGGSLTAGSGLNINVAPAAQAGATC